MKKLTQNDFIEKAKNIHKNNYDYSKVNYINGNSKITLVCNKCGLEFDVIAKKHLYDKVGCPHCNKIRNRKNLPSPNKKDLEYFTNKAKSIFGNEYDYSEVNYINTNIKVKIKCNKCGEYFFQTPHNHLSGFEGCKNCKSQSLGEDCINEILKNKNIEFIWQMSYPDLKDTICLSYDFYIPKSNLLIEYNGEQHYKAIDYFGGYNKFLKQKHHDWLKRKYAKEHNIKLLIIPYWDFDNIETIINSL